MDKLADQLQQIITLFQQNTLVMLKFIGLLWAIQCVNWLLGYRLNRLGIKVRSWRGLLGILFAPFLHGSFKHLFFNTIPLFLLGNLVLMEGLEAWGVISILIIVLEGFLTWAFARKAIHVGASALIMGYFGYLLANTYYHVNMTTILLAMICVYYCGGLFFSILPEKKEVSWESHLFGLLSGIVVAYFF